MLASTEIGGGGGGGAGAAADDEAEAAGLLNDGDAGILTAPALCLRSGVASGAVGVIGCTAKMTMGSNESFKYHR